MLNATFPLRSSSLLRPEHTLPVTSIHSGQGGSAAVLATCGLDRAVKLHRLSDGKLLASHALPSGLNCVVMDAGEHALYVGGTEGVIYEVSLVGSSSGAAGRAGSAAAVSGAAVGASTSSSSHYTRMEGHGRAINALAMSVDGESMVSGSDDGTTCVWDLRSRQVVQVWVRARVRLGDSI